MGGRANLTNPESMDSMAKRLRTLRKALGRTQGKMALAIGSGSGAAMWSNYEAGYRRISTDHALNLCRKYGLTMDWIYRGNPGICDPQLMKALEFQEQLEQHQSRTRSREPI